MKYRNDLKAHLLFTLGMLFMIYKNKLKHNHKKNILRYKKKTTPLKTWKNNKQ